MTFSFDIICHFISQTPRIFLFYRHSSTAFLFPVRRISAIRIHCLLLFAITAVDFPDPVNLCKVFCTCTADPRKNGTRNIVPYTEDRARKCCKRIGCKISCASETARPLFCMPTSIAIAVVLEYSTWKIFAARSPSIIPQKLWIATTPRTRTPQLTIFLHLLPRSLQ